MKQLKKKGVFDIANIIISIVLVIVTFIVSFLIVGSTAGDLTAAADNISGSGLPLAGLYASNGVVLLIFMAGLLVALIVVAFSMAKMTKLK